MSAAVDRWADARLVADAVLYEGYVLYPYRASATKNQMRWQFGVLVPPARSEVDRSERSTMRTQCVVDPGATPELTVRVRFLQVQRRTVERSEGCANGSGPRFVDTDALDVDGARVVAWDEAVEHDVDVAPFLLLPLATARREAKFHVPSGEDVELVHGVGGVVAGRVVRRRTAIGGVVRASAEWAAGPGALLKVTVTVDNVTAWDGAGDTADEARAARDDVVRHSLVAVHTMLALADGEFVSLLDPPEHAVEAVAGCVNDGTFPVLVGAEGTTALVLSSPIILYDHPAVAPESQGDLYDATEIDEILALRVLTMTDEEKAEARGTDRRAAAIVDRCDDMPPEVWERLHGAVRSLHPAPATDPFVTDPFATDSTGAASSAPWWDPGVDASVDPGSDTVVVGGVEIGRGASVRLCPSHRADAQDLFLAGLTATVAGIFRDVDGNDHVAVTVDSDPATELLDWQGRYLYFHPDELEPLSEASR